MIRAALIAVFLLAGCKSSNFAASKPGTSKEQSDRDVALCEERASKATKSRIATPYERNQTYNRLVIDCLRDRGYTMSGD